MTRAAIVAALLASILTRAQYLMGTVCEINADVPADAAFAEAQRIESMLSTWRDDTELARVNRGATAGPELAALLATTETYSRETDGAFNPHIRCLLDAWGIRGARTSRPQSASVPLADRSPAETASDCGRDVRAPIEEGAFAKGYAID